MELASCLCLHSKVGGIKRTGCDRNIYCITQFVLRGFAVDLVSFCLFSYLQLTDLITHVSPCGECDAGRYL